jgi:hypothetical protein
VQNRTLFKGSWGEPLQAERRGATTTLNKSDYGKKETTAMSAQVNVDYTAWPNGTRVYTKRAIDLRPYTVLPPGAIGTVVDNGAPFGVEVLFDELQPGLGPWHNCALLVDDALRDLRIIPSACAACPDFPHTSATLYDMLAELTEGVPSDLVPMIAAG